jgi:excisionase family DNA binding protein
VDATTETAALELASDGAVPIPEAVRFSGCSRSVLYERMAAGEIRFITVGRRRLIPKRSLVEFLAKRVNGAA